MAVAEKSYQLNNKEKLEIFDYQIPLKKRKNRRYKRLRENRFTG